MSALHIFSEAVYAKEQAGTKKQVGNKLALNLVSQLYKMGAIEPCKAPGSKKKESMVSSSHVLLCNISTLPTSFSNLSILLK